MAFVEDKENTPAAQMRDFKKRQDAAKEPREQREPRDRRQNREERKERSQERNQRKGNDMPFNSLSSITASPFGGVKTKVLEGVNAAYRSLQ